MFKQISDRLRDSRHLSSLQTHSPSTHLASGANYNNQHRWTHIHDWERKKKLTATSPAMVVSCMKVIIQRRRSICDWNRTQKKSDRKAQEGQRIRFQVAHRKNVGQYQAPRSSDSTSGVGVLEAVGMGFPKYFTSPLILIGIGPNSPFCRAAMASCQLCAVQDWE
jgi:hypothetical protein